MDSDSSSSTEVTVETALWRSAVTEVEQACGRAVAAALERQRPAHPANALVSILLTDDARIRELNRRFRGRDQATNVLAFPAGDPLPAGARPMPLGDIAIAFETTSREAAQEGRSVVDHLSHLVVHGVLHLLGHDHDEDAAALAMEGLETAILAGLGIADPYGTEAR